MEAFGEREDVFFVATLVTSDVNTLDFSIPENARVAKFIPLDLILPYVRTFFLSCLQCLSPLTPAQVSVLVTNGGFGTVQQSLRAGVPMIISGIGQDKLHTGTLINYTGVGIYHAVPQVTVQMLTDAFEELTSNKTYR
jgi:UDP:flavonoid glycosyltransferase YjiC (YdhE family)